MGQVARFTVSIEEDLLDDFERYLKEQKFETRSEAVRQIVRDTLAAQRWKSQSGRAEATLTIVYDHHHGQLQERLMELQHDHTDMIVSTLHVHLDHNSCLEVIVLRGTVSRLADLAARLKGLKGIQHGSLVVARVTPEKSSRAAKSNH